MFRNSDKHQAWETGIFILEWLSIGVRLLITKDHSRPLKIEYALWSAVFFPAFPLST